MLRQKTLSSMRILVSAALGLLALGSLAWGQAWGQHDDDDYYYHHDEAREHGFQNGYRAGLRAGQSDSERGRRFNFKNDDWEDSRGYEHWMGNHGSYKQAYREGYERGYRRAYSYDDRYRDRDDYRWRDRDWR